MRSRLWASSIRYRHVLYMGINYPRRGGESTTTEMPRHPSRAETKVNREPIFHARIDGLLYSRWDEASVKEIAHYTHSLKENARK